MRIALVNKFYYPRGGDCIYTLRLEEMLRERGHEVAVFAMRHPQNLECEPWSRFFPPEVSFRPGRGALEALRRPLGTKAVRRLWNAFLDEARPDVVHAGNIHSQLSPLLMEEAHRRGIRTVWTLHDYKLLCPRYDCLRPGHGPCRDCFYGSKRRCLTRRCVKGSLPASLIGWLEARRWNMRRLAACTDAFICPSRFMADMMASGGAPEGKLHALCNFTDAARCAWPDHADRGDYYIYSGRLSHEKGVPTLISAALRHPDKPLLIAGDGPLRPDIERTVAQAGAKHIHMLGHLGWEELKPRLARARLAVIPSEWYENNPLSVIEAQSLGTPVLGAAIGGIPELTALGGDLFAPGDAHALARAIGRMWDAPCDHAALSARALDAYSPARYYERLMELYLPKH